jgi:hypothetical protein
MRALKYLHVKGGEIIASCCLQGHQILLNSTLSCLPSL